MARMGADGYSDEETGQAKVTTRCPAELKAEYKQVLDEQGRSMSEAIRDHMETVVEASDADGSAADTLPDDEQLAAAYKALRRHADPDSATIETDIAESIVAEATRVRASVVRANVLKPLERREYIQPRWGEIKVRPPQAATVAP